MSLKEEIKPYIDGYNLVSNRLVQPHEIRSSDNGTMFTSEYHIILENEGLSTKEDKDEWERIMRTCMNAPGLTARAPNDDSIENSPDNMLAVLAASNILNKRSVARDMFFYGLKNLGFYNGSNPNHIFNKDGSLDWSAFMWRQPQILFAMLVASRIFHVFLVVSTILTALQITIIPGIILTLLELYTMGVILIESKKDRPLSDGDGWRLTWALIKATSNGSILCYLASKKFYRVLREAFGDEEMKAVAKAYYLDNHPFHRYNWK